jgi:hypothetical protein
MLRLRDTMEIEDADGHSVATVKKAMITPHRTGRRSGGLCDRFETYRASLPGQIGHPPDVRAGRDADHRRV